NRPPSRPWAFHPAPPSAALAAPWRYGCSACNPPASSERKGAERSRTSSTFHDAVHRFDLNFPSQDVAFLTADERRDVFFPGEQHLFTPLESTGVFVCMALDDDRLGRADDGDELNGWFDLLDRFDGSLGMVAAIDFVKIVFRRRNRQNVDGFRWHREACGASGAHRHSGGADKFTEGRVQPAAVCIRRNHLAIYQRIAPDEFRHELTARARIELVGRADLFDTAGVHDHD